MEYKPSRLQPLLTIIRFIILLIIFYGIALIVSPAKTYTAFFYLKIFVPITIVMSVYIIVTSKGAVINLSENTIEINLDFSRNKKTVLNKQNIGTVSMYQSLPARALNLYQIRLAANTSVPDDEKKASLISQYMVFDKETADKILSYLKN